MDGKEENNGSGQVVRDENSSQINVSTAGKPAAGPPVGPSQPPAAAPPHVAGELTPSTEVKKKRGRPRKYGPDGKATMTLSPMPISASIPLTGDYSSWKHGQGKPINSIKKKQKVFETLGERVAYSVGANFTPHIILVCAGEDINMKIISFAQQGSRAICILAANGSISNVTLRQPNSSGGTLTYEGRFEILSLLGSFMPSDIGGTKGRTGGMSVSLAGPDGRVLGGGLAGMLVAAGPVQVVVGSFLPGHQMEQKPKKQKFKTVPATTPIASIHSFGEGTDRAYGEPPKLNFGPANSIHESRSSEVENNGALPRSESKEINLSSPCEISC